MYGVFHFRARRKRATWAYSVSFFGRAMTSAVSDLPNPGMSAGLFSMVRGGSFVVEDSGQSGGEIFRANGSRFDQESWRSLPDLR